MGVYDRFAEHYDLIYKEIVDYEKETDDFEKLFARAISTSSNCMTGNLLKHSARLIKFDVTLHLKSRNIWRIMDLHSSAFSTGAPKA
jgi:hypothetical protein